MRRWLQAALPLVLLAVLLLAFVRFGPIGVFKAAFPPVEVAFIQRVEFSPEHITVHVFNDGPEPVTIAQVLVNDAYWQFSMASNVLQPLQKGLIDIAYPWLEGDPMDIQLLTSTGVTFDREIAVVTSTPQFGWLYFRTFVLLGIYVGVLPVLIGLLWFPFLRLLRGSWYSALLALTVGLLVFLGFDTLAEALELLPQLPGAFNGVGILVIGFLLAVMALGAVSHKTEQYSAQRGEEGMAITWGYLIALGIGLHNLGEGLAIGSAYALGEIALGSTLVIGFMVHNVTEGVAIVAPLTRSVAKVRAIVVHLVAMGLLAGGPTILGALLGGFTYSAALNVLFLAIGAGAIFDVSFDILHYMAKGRWNSLFTPGNILGFLAGLLVVYVTGFLVL